MLQLVCQPGVLSTQLRQSRFVVLSGARIADLAHFQPVERH
jgi:hypothetical protein